MLKIRRGLAMVLALLLAVGIGGSVALAAPGADEPGSQAVSGDLFLEKRVTSPQPVKPGEFVTYEIKVGCSNIEQPCTGAKLVDFMPAPLVVTNVTPNGFSQEVGQDINPDGTVTLTFNEVSPDFPGKEGLFAGGDYTITITAQLPADASAELGGAVLKNNATLSSDEDSVNDDADVTLEIDPELGAGITKSWQQDSTVAGEETANALTLGGITNTSKVGASELVITEPSGGTDPFASVAFTGFGDIVYPEGADKLEISYTDATGTKTLTAAPNAPPVFPNGTNLSEITGFTFTFSSSATTETKGGIAAKGTAGSIVLNTKVRDGISAGVVNNETSIVAKTPKGPSKPATAEDSFTISAVEYNVEASKTFSPAEVVAETPEFEDRTQNKSTVTLGAKNTSNQPLASMTLTEPATGTDPFGNGINFDEFLASDWPANTGSIVVNIAGKDYTLTNNDGKIGFPADMPKGSTVTSFKATFNAAEGSSYAPGESVGLKFGVIGMVVGAHENVVQAGGKSPGGTDAKTHDAKDTLTVVAPVEKIQGSKGFAPNRVEGIVGDKTTASISAKPIDPTNADVREIVQTEDFSAMTPAWAAKTVTIANRQGADTVKVEYMNAAGAWVVLIANAGAEAITVPAGATQLRITYTRTAGTFPKGQDVTANVGFELTQELADVEASDLSNVLGVKNGDNVTTPITVDKKIQLTTAKSWNPATIIQKPSAKNPKSTLTLSATNTSTYAVDSLALAEPSGGTKPFDYVNMTGFSAALGGGATVDTAVLKLTFFDGTTLPLSGNEAVNPGSVVPPINFAEVVGFDFSLVKTDTSIVPRDAKFTLTVGTELRDTLRGSTTPIDEALAKVTTDVVDPAYTIKNTTSGTIKRGNETAEKDASADLKVTTNNSVTIKPELVKSFNPVGPTTLFPITNMDVKLTLSSGTDKADKIVLEDTDPTFWNAYDFVNWKDMQSGPQGAKLTYEFLTGATFTTVDGKVEVSGGTWTKAENLATTIGALRGAHTAEAPMTAVQGFRITVEAGNFDELARVDNTFEFTVKPRYVLRSGELNSPEGDTPNPGEAKDNTVTNTASGSVSRLGEEHKAPDANAEYVFTPGTVGATVNKINNASNNQVSAGGQLTYTMTVTNSGTEPILNPKIVDKLPSDPKGPLMVVADDFAGDVKYTLNNANAAAKPGTTLPTDNTLVTAIAAADEVTFTFPEGSVLYPGESYVVVLPVTIRAGVPANTPMTNKVSVDGDNLVTPVDGDSAVGIIEGQAYSSMKLVREVPAAGQDTPTGVHNTVNKDAACYEFEGGFYRFPCIVETKPGGTSEWKLQVTNTGNVPTNRLEIVDVFPWIGDHGVTVSQSGTPRGTKWTPTLLDINDGTLPEGATQTIFYLTGDPASCKPTGSISDGNPWTGCDTNWQTERPANPKDIMGLKAVYDFAAPGLAPGSGVELSFTMQSATEMPDGAGELAPAWNSFGYYANAQVNGNTDHRSQEPIKTGITFRPVAKEKVSVGDYVWIDTNKDGRQDTDEKGIKDVVLVLTGPDGNPVTDVYGNPVLPTMTDENGFYTFENLPVLKDGESYTVTINQGASHDVLAPYHPTKAGQGDRQGDSSTWEAKSEGLTVDGQRDPTLDFGFILTPGKVSVGDYVWVDSNRDGIQDEDEKGIKDVVLIITGPDGNPVTDVFGNPVGPATTDENGIYTFENLPVLKDGESYTVSIDRGASKEPLAPYIPTIETEGDRGSDSSTWTAKSEGLTTDGDRDPTLDFGFITPKVSVGDYVWVDSNRDGIQDEGEKGIKDVVLVLTGPDGKPVTDVFGNPVLPTKTDENGKYTFENLPVLPAGEHYTVSIDREASKEPLAPYVPTVDTGADRETNSSTWTATSKDLTVDGDRDPSLDFGFVLPKVSVGDYVWVDTNRDGIQDDDEKGIKDVVLVLTGPDGKPVTDVFGNPVLPTKTDENGAYTFENLPVLKAGESYTVTIDQDASKEPLAPYIPTIDTGDDRATNSSTWTAKSEGLTEDGQRDPTLDFGFVQPKVSVGDYVWVDTDRDGVQDEGEKGIKDVVLIITGPDGKPVTDVFGNPVGPVTTDENGKYTFENLPVLKEGESYTVSIDREASKDPLAPYIPTIDTGDDRETNSSTWEAKSEGLTEDGEHDPTLDFGFVLPKVSVGDYVWVDTNRDGIQDENEKGIKDVVLIITGPDGKPVTDVYGNPVGPVTTDENGKYTFENLPVLKDGESYTVTIDQDASKDPLAPYIPTIDTGDDRATNSSTWTATTEGLTKDGDRDPSLDFGFVLPKVSVGDYVWVDTNRDGIQDEGENGIKDVVLIITGPDGKPVTDVFGNPVLPTKTDENGLYTFENLPVLKDGESYTVTIDKEASKDPLAPYIPTIDTGDDRATNSSTWEATTEGLTKDGDRDPSLDFGFVLPKVSVGDYVWVDTNRDGIQDENEKGIKDVVLIITGPDGEPVTDVYGNPVGPVTTDENGKYTFENLPVLKDGESYKVSIDKEASKDALAPYIPTIETEGDRGKDSSTWEATTEGLTTDGEHDPSLDFGFVLPKVSIGDYVWVDNNKNGRQDAGEPGIQDVVLVLSGPDGKPVTDVFGKLVGPVSTDKDGLYTFENLPVLKDGQSYTVSIDRKLSAKALAPYTPTVAGQGDRLGDSSTWTASSEGLTQDGDRDPTLDFGFFLTPDPVVPTTPGTTPSTPATDDLSNTGFDGAVLMAMGLLLTLLGGGAIAMTARRRRASTARH